MSFFKELKDIISIGLLDGIMKSLTFRDFMISHSRFFLRIEMNRTKKRQEKTLKIARGKKQINVVFFLQSPAVWKYDRIYRMMEVDNRFNPIIAITPFNVHLNYDKNECIQVMRISEQFAKNQNYKYVQTYNTETQKWIDIRKIYNPDIVFFTKPYKDTLYKYHIYNFKDKLTCYTPYGFYFTTRYKFSAKLPIYSLLWKFFVETEFQKQVEEQYAVAKGQNTIVSGCLVTEPLIDPNYIPKNNWKEQKYKKKKRIIWAPHHTINYLFNFSTFLTYAEFMLEMAKKYKDDIQFAFKPHPILKVKLINMWGKEKTEAYYHQWELLENTQIEEGYYMDLFLTSDALIHDCDSFRGEYLYLPKKPVLFLVRDDSITEVMNEFGKNCFDMHYHAYQKEQIEHFIQDVVINGNDPMRPQRETFFKEYLYPKDGIMPSQKIMNILKEELGK